MMPYKEVELIRTSYRGMCPEHRALNNITKAYIFDFTHPSLHNDLLQKMANDLKIFDAVYVQGAIDPSKLIFETEAGYVQFMLTHG